MKSNFLNAHKLLTKYRKIYQWRKSIVIKFIVKIKTVLKKYKKFVYLIQNEAYFDLVTRWIKSNVSYRRKN